MKLFNKLRLRMIKGKRLRNYILYAFGEIILVVIGILIALGINSSREQRQLESANNDLKSQVINQLKADIKEIETYERELDTIEQGYRKILNRSYDSTKVRNSSVIASILLELNTITLDNRVVNLIDNAKLIDNDVSKCLIDLSSTYKLYHEDIEAIEELIINAMNENLKAIENTQDWYVEFITDFICKDGCVKFLLYNEDHKKRMASLRFFYVDGYGGIIEELREELKSKLTILELL